MPHSWFSYDGVAASYASSAEPVYFSRPAEDLISRLLGTQEGLHSALAGAGFGDIAVHRREYSVETTTVGFIQSRLMSAPARSMQAQLAPARWDDFVVEISRDIVDHFGERVAFRTSVNFGIGIASRS